MVPILVGVEFLTPGQWEPRVAAHEARVDDLLTDHLARQSRGEAHPVEDFLFRYYPFRPASLRRWHPGATTTLLGDPPHAGWPGYVRDGGGVRVSDRLVEKRRSGAEWIADLLRRTASRPARTDCFGLHEWAMVYRSTPDDVRHQQVPLRLGHDGTDAVVDSHKIRCTHYDAHRFFTDAAAPRNTITPTRATMADLEQPGCLHTNMDVYRWAGKVSPLVGSDIVLDAFVLAREIRELDMRASPYDVTSLGLAPVPIETPDGKAEYVAAQRDFADRAAILRARLLAALDDVLAVRAA